MPSMDKIIFYLGNEGGEASKKIVSIRVLECANRASAEGLEGLRIVIGNGETGSNALLAKSAASTSMLLRLPELGFLKSCCLCRRELKPCKDVYMYRYCSWLNDDALFETLIKISKNGFDLSSRCRGDQGFCSDECRSRRILLDERRELEVTARDRARAHRHQRHRETPNKISKPDLNRRVSAVAWATRVVFVPFLLDIYRRNGFVFTELKRKTNYIASFFIPKQWYIMIKSWSFLRKGSSTRSTWKFSF